MIASKAEFQSGARGVLLANHAGGWTKPAADQYPHQWNWDSGFISLGWATFDWEKAAAEIESVIRGRWRDGMIPHVRYDPHRLQDYFPGPDRWPGMAGHVAEAGEMTSGISNPPIIILAALRIGLVAPNPQLRDAFWRRVLPPLTEWLRWFFTARRLPGCPLVAIVHPWETGWDNSPRWDGLRAAGLRPKRRYERLDTRAVASQERPAGRDYDSYLALAEIISEGDFDLPSYRSRTPFVIYDVVFDALVYRAARDLNSVAARLDAMEPFTESELDDFSRAFEDHHWDRKCLSYLDWDAQSGQRIQAPSAAAVACLAGGLIPSERAGLAAEGYLARCGSAHPICSVPPGAAGFDPNLYWRGPVWVNVNWLVIDGLRRSGLDRAAASLTRSTLGLVERGGFAEYFNPVDGSPRGSGNFSWTAALVLDLLQDRNRQAP